MSKPSRFALKKLSQRREDAKKYFWVMTENEIAKIVVDTALMIHRELGPGLLESVYEEVLAYELENRDLTVERQRGVEVEWDGRNLGKGFVADLVVNSLVIIELKSVQKLEPIHFKQLLTYLN